MTPKKAIAILNQQKAKLDHLSNLNDATWKTQTSSYIKDFFGDNSSELNFFSKTSFYVSTYDYQGQQFNQEALAKIKIAKTFIDNCIQTINHKGLYKAHKLSFFNRISDTAKWTIIGVAVPGLLSIGFFFGNLYSDKQNIDLRQENKELKDSLSSIIPSLPNAKPITNGDTNKTQKTQHK